MDATGTDEAVLVGWSRAPSEGRSSRPSTRSACSAPPESAWPCRSGPPTVPRRHRAFLAPQVSYEGWGKWNIHYWRRDYEDFIQFFFDHVFSEPHSTKQIEDSIGWGLETDPETLAATVQTGEFEDREETLELCRRVSCPMLVVHGEDDAIRPSRSGAARQATGGRFVPMPGLRPRPARAQARALQRPAQRDSSSERPRPSAGGRIAGSMKGDHT